MNIEIINIGDELLIGQVINTNASWMASELNLNGMNVSRISVIPDASEAIVQALTKALESVDIVLLTGGLGPTKDDITKNTLCEFFNSRLIENKETLENIRRIFSQRGYELTESNRKQAEVPECCKAIINKLGTAPCMCFEKNGKSIISMPGVPFEMQTLMREEVIPYLKKRFQTEHFVHKTLLTFGIGESFLSDKLELFEKELPFNIKLAYLPQVGVVRLRLSGKGTDVISLENEISVQVEKLKSHVGEYLFGYDLDTLEKVVGDLLKKGERSLSVAESCTGGYISHLLTSIPGSSVYFKGSVVAYSNEVKNKVLSVKKETLEEFGAVSEQTAKEMAIGIKNLTQSDFAIATTGIAGPDGGSDQKPVGTVWIAVATPENVIAQKYSYGNDRIRTIQRTANQALNNLRLQLLDY